MCVLCYLRVGAEIDQQVAKLVQDAARNKNRTPLSSAAQSAYVSVTSQLATIQRLVKQRFPGVLLSVCSDLACAPFNMSGMCL